MPNRYSRPICAPESIPNRSPATSPKLSFSGRVKRCVTRNALAGDAGGALELLDQIAVVGIARDDAGGARLAAHRGIHQLLVGDVMIQVHAARWIAARARVAVCARRAAGAVGRFENIALN